ncbi:MAG TPA: RHS repeat domain-containing protein, partial [Pyrinomonadaceae bacterium]
MTHANAAPRRDPSKTFTRHALALVLLLAACAAARAQTTSATDGSTPEGMKPGAPAGSYRLSGFDNVNFFNGNLNFRLPLLGVGGRGSASSSVSLTIERKWGVARTLSNPATYFPETGGWSGLEVGYGPGVLVGRLAGATSLTCGGQVEVNSLLRLTFISSDGTEYELRDTAAYGDPGTTQYLNCQVSDTTQRGTEFVTADGTSATFISDTALQDGYNGAPEQIYPWGYLMLRDGTRYRIEGGLVRWQRDRNGNKVGYDYDAAGRVMKITDSLGREVTFGYGPSQTVPYSDTITYNGFGGAARTIRVRYGMMGTALRGDQTLKSEHDLFPSLNGASTSGAYDTVVATSVELPDGRSYHFKYNSYAELARVELPTGGAFEYDWDGGFTLNSPGLYFVGAASTGSYHVYRRVVERRVYPDGGAGASFASRMTIGKPDANNTAGSYAEVKSYDGAGALLAWERHHFYGTVKVDPNRKPTDYEKWKTGREWKTEAFDPAFSTTAAARTTMQTWQQPVGGQRWPLATAETSDAARTNEPQVTRVQATLAETGQVSKQEFAYDFYVNRTDVREYDYWTGSTPPAHATRHTHTDYLTAAAYVNADANPGLGASLRGLPAAQQVYAVNTSTGQETPVAKSETHYDETPPAPYGPVTGWADPGTPARGNATRTGSWVDTTNTWVEARAEYDQCGSPVKTIDALGHETQVGYSPAYAYAYATSVTTAAPAPTPVPDPSGGPDFGAGAFGSAAGFTSLTAYDFSTGLVTSATDANGETTAYDYTDPLDRLKAVARPDGGATTYDYGRYNNAGRVSDYVRTATSLDPARSVVSYQFFDGLGRPDRSFLSEGGSPEIWLTSDTRYDA